MFTNELSTSINTGCSLVYFPLIKVLWQHLGECITSNTAKGLSVSIVLSYVTALSSRILQVIQPKKSGRKRVSCDSCFRKKAKSTRTQRSEMAAD